MTFKNITQGEREKLVQFARVLAKEAGNQIMPLYKRGIEIKLKSDSSPVTDADNLADDIIVSGLFSKTPAIPIISEERIAKGQRPSTSNGLFWLVDPLDGTKEFISGTDEFTVNIALIEDNKPILGVLYAPAVDDCFFSNGKTAYHINKKAECKQIRARKIPKAGATALVSRHHLSLETKNFVAENDIVQTKVAGSALKFGLLASGKADLYPRFSPTMEWDIAAGHAILVAAGGSIKQINGKDVCYGKNILENPFFIARGLE